MLLVSDCYFYFRRILLGTTGLLRTELFQHNQVVQKTKQIANTTRRVYDRKNANVAMHGTACRPEAQSAAGRVEGGSK